MLNATDKKTNNNFDVKNLNKK